MKHDYHLQVVRTKNGKMRNLYQLDYLGLFEFSSSFSEDSTWDGREEATNDVSGNYMNSLGVFPDPNPLRIFDVIPSTLSRSVQCQNRCSFWLCDITFK